MSSGLSRRKRLAFKAVVVIFAVACVEVSSAVLLEFCFGGVRRVFDERDKTIETDQNYFSLGESADIVHPYLGFVHQPTPTGGTTEFGFYDVVPPLHKRERGTTILGIVGGSVAEGIACDTTQEIAKELRKSPRFSESKFVFVRIACGGHKQPQQLMTVNYLLALGAQFDILINLDGFNDVVFPIVANVPNKVFPAFPHNWDTTIAHISQPLVSRLVGHITHLKIRKRRLARFFSGLPLRYSVTSALVWKFLCNETNWSILQDSARIHSIVQKEHNYCASGPRIQFADAAELNEYCVDLWSRSSRLLHHLCTTNEIEYFHFLQPNQYVPGSKPMGVREKAIAVNSESPYRIPVEDCYPLLIREGNSLRKQGIRFHDLTQIFADHPEPIYSDDCCHFNDQGQLILARKIGAFIAKAERKFVQN